MARPKKLGLDYFPLDVDFADDDKFLAIEATHGPAACYLIIRLFADSFRAGYARKFGINARKLFCYKSRVDEKELDAVLETAFNVGLFDRSVFENTEHLTSKALQRRYQEAVRKRQTFEKIEGVWLLDEFPAGFRAGNVESIPKVKESKVKESKGKESKVKLGCVRTDDLAYLFPKATREHFADEFETNSHHTSTGRIPMAKYDTIWLTPTELANVADTYDLAEFPRNRWSIPFGLVDAQNKKSLNNGKSLTFIDSYTALIGWAFQRALEQTASSLRVSREAEYLGRARS